MDWGNFLEHSLLSFDTMVSYGIRLMVATFLFLQYLERRDRFWLRFAAGYGLLLVACRMVFSRMMGNHVVLIGLAFTLAFLMNIGCVGFCCRVSIKEAVACALFGLLTEHTTNSLFVLFFPNVYTLTWEYLLFDCVIFLLIWRFVARKMTVDRHYLADGAHVTVLSVVCVAITIWLSLICKLTADPEHDGIFENETLGVMLRLSQVYDLVFCITVLATQLVHTRQILTQMKLQMSRDLLRQQEEQYRLTKDTIDLINRKCHDMKHQVAILMEQSGGSAKMREQYCKEINQMIEIYDNKIDTGNEVLNTILMDRSLYCAMHEIHWSCAARGEALSFMEPMDLACIVCNAVDNAVEATERIPDPGKRVVHVQIMRKEAFVHIVVENSFDGNLVWQDGKPLTSKENNGYHGFGIGNISATAEKYGGHAEITADSSTFALSVLLPIPGGSQ